MLKKEKKTHQSPSSHQVPKLKLMKKEKIGQDFFFFGTVSTEDWSFGGWQVGNGTSANESVSKKTKQKNKK